jgi:flavin reductase (DIM6/NTAB) family NADH-FMN oxidoreductase RutF
VKIMNRRVVDPFDYIDETNELMRDGGILLVTQDKAGKPNAMTIGWGFLGTIWRNPFFIVAVRHSRHTFKNLEETNSFTVCLPAVNMEKVLETCGSKSGRDMDKISELGLTAVKSEKVETPYIEESPLHYECQIVYSHDLRPEDLPEELRGSIYSSGDIHKLYFGEVKGVYAVKDAAQKLPED